MTGDEVRQIREALGRALGSRVSQHDLGLMLGMSPANAGRKARAWEQDGPTGPVAVALDLLSRATDLWKTTKLHDPVRPFMLSYARALLVEGLARAEARDQGVTKA